MSVHAKLSPSSAHRWLVCSAAPSMEAGLPDTTSVYAEEGTTAHAAAEAILRGDMEAISVMADEIDGKYPDMPGYVDDYVAYVQAQPGRLYIERKVDYSDWVEGGFGTSDAITIHDGCLTVIDLKYGKGNRVDAEENPQLMLYALGALNEFDFLFEIDRVRLVVHQPRLDHVSEWETNKIDLLEWAEYVRERAEYTATDDPEFVPGEKQCQWCKAQAICRALQELTFSVALEGFDEVRDPKKLSNSEIAEILPQLKLLTSFVKAVEAYAYSEIENGRDIPGYKLVQGRALRKWDDLDAVEKRFKSAKLKVAEMFSKKLISPAQAERLLGKDHPILRDHAIKPEGKPSLAPAADKRPALTFDPTAGFENLETEEGNQTDD